MYAIRSYYDFQSLTHKPAAAGEILRIVRLGGSPYREPKGV